MLVNKTVLVFKTVDPIGVGMGGSKEERGDGVWVLEREKG